MRPSPFLIAGLVLGANSTCLAQIRIPVLKNEAYAPESSRLQPNELTALKEIIKNNPALANSYVKPLHPNKFAAPGVLEFNASKLNELIISEFNAADLNFEVPEPVAHTNYDIPAAGGGKLFPETPQSIACLYMFPPGPSRDCINTDANVKPTGGANITIAIVIAYDHDVGTINEELRIFSQNFQILDANFLPIVYASGAKPHQDPTKNKDWNFETSLDLEWAHAMAPAATLLLVESDDAKFSNLSKAVQVAGNLVQKAGGGVVSMSWSWRASDVSGANQKAFNNNLSKYDKVTFVAASGDLGLVEFPASSPKVVAAGGTRLLRDANTGAFKGESAWKASGAGNGADGRPSFQDPVQNQVGPTRGIVDVAAAAANGDAGASKDDQGSLGSILVYNASAGKSWYGVQGTSASAPIIAGLIANALTQDLTKTPGGGSFSPMLERIYNHYKDSLQAGGPPFFFDVQDGTNCGLSMQFQATAGWDFCTGVGTPLGLFGFRQ